PPYFFWKRSRQENLNSFSSSIRNLLNHCEGRNNGFTLAEVLITLVIIGVIAALTVPTMIAKYQKQALTTAFKKSYSIVSQAIAKSQMENGPLETWDFPSSVNNETTAQVVEKYILPYLQVAKNCKTESGKDCFSANTTYKKINGSDYQIVDSLDKRYRFVLNDGSLVSIEVVPNSCLTTAKKRCIIFQVDINGKKGPNQLGRDYFSFSAYPFTNNVMPDGTYDLYSSNRYDDAKKTWNRIPIERINQDCNPKGSGEGWLCAGKIMQEGWQMNY
ncbi:type II secretion system protein, partial [bacterium]|nr:type II secretion system protein [bacterium]